jgi:hypothetical protein
MTNISTVYTAAQFKELLEDTAADPAIAIGGPSTASQPFHLTIRVEGGGLSITPLEIYEALDTKFEAVSGNFLPTHNSMEFVIHKTTEAGIEAGENPESIQ